MVMDLIEGSSANLVQDTKPTQTVKQVYLAATELSASSVITE
jgi:hypothetical protein